MSHGDPFGRNFNQHAGKVVGERGRLGPAGKLTDEETEELRKWLLEFRYRRLQKTLDKVADEKGWTKMTFEKWGKTARPESSNQSTSIVESAFGQYKRKGFHTDWILNGYRLAQIYHLKISDGANLRYPSRRDPSLPFLFY